MLEFWIRVIVALACFWWLVAGRGRFQTCPYGVLKIEQF